MGRTSENQLMGTFTEVAEEMRDVYDDGSIISVSYWSSLIQLINFVLCSLWRKTKFKLRTLNEHDFFISLICLTFIPFIHSFDAFFSLFFSKRFLNTRESVGWFRWGWWLIQGTSDIYRNASDSSESSDESLTEICVSLLWLRGVNTFLYCRLFWPDWRDLTP